jgi:MSHA pilin protein MshA
MKKQTGFTLVELIIVIVILGILAVTAAPKFLDLQGDANASTIQGVAGAADSASSIVYGKSVIAGEQKLTAQNIQADTGETINTEYGYPEASANGIVLAMDVSVDSTGSNGADFNFSTSTASGIAGVTDGTPVAYFYANGTPNPAAPSGATEFCAVTYVEAELVGTTYIAAKTFVDTTGC